MTAFTLGSLRRRLRAERRALSRAERQAASAALARRLATLPAFQRARRIAAYWPADGEIDPLPALRRAAAAGKACYLPVLCPQRDGHLHFAAWNPQAPLRRNRFGIVEPAVAPRHWLAPRMLDLVLVPLVGFDGAGNRLGMGGGFYDRSFAFLGQRRWRRPRLVGVAFDLQRVDRLPRRAWDVPLDAVASERGCYRFRMF
ncbi:5-formyltetrahydrofolate cyclo-ligase [Immundisolibacter sp.]|uniref:5-formyltetrahydrofolate cyclo-ligase n=1 Tax=Immundisolibacter sp. TaxID=1934948 RepID=UPI00356B361E